MACPLLRCVALSSCIKVTCSIHGAVRCCYAQSQQLRLTGRLQITVLLKLT